MESRRPVDELVQRLIELLPESANAVGLVEVEVGPEPIAELGSNLADLSIGVRAWVVDQRLERARKPGLVSPREDPLERLRKYEVKQAFAAVDPSSVGRDLRDELAEAPRVGES